MAMVQNCTCCGLTATAPICSNCQEQIGAGQRKDRRKLRDDCPLHPGKKIWCRAFGSTAGYFATKSRTCSRHWQDELHKETRARIELIQRLQDRKSNIGPFAMRG